MSKDDQKAPGTARRPRAMPERSSSETHSPKNGATTPPGLDPDHHAASQRAAHQADVLGNAVMPAMMATALNLAQVGASGYRAYLDRLLADAGSPSDPIEIMLLEQLAIAHFRIAQLHGSAGQAQGIEAQKLLCAAAARLLGEFRRTALAIRVYRTGVPEGKAEGQMKIHKLAQ